ncbi:MAG TPA: DUF4157 domain-containing protein, partial [Kofleriaceae bacterium]
MGIGKSSLSGGMLQLRRGGESSEVSRAGASTQPSVGKSTLVEQIAGGGTRLPEQVRVKMERSLGADFSAVRIHEGPQAAAMGALAYTQG